MRRWPFFVLVLASIVGCGKATESADDASSSPPNYAAAKSADAESSNGGMRLASKESVPEATRLVVRNGDLSLRVKEIKAAETEVDRLATNLGGTVEASQGTELAGPSPELSITLRVPERRFVEAMDRLESLGVRLGKTISSEDVTSQAVDLDARLKSLRVQEDAYRIILSNARKVSDVLQVQERLTGVRTSIEQLVAQRRGLGDQAARSTIVVHLTQTARPEAPAAEPDWANENWAAAVSSLKSFGRGLASVGIWAAAFAPIWLPAGLLLLFLLRRAARSTVKA